MKYSIWLVLGLMLSFSTEAISQKLKGNGHVVEKEISVEDFSKIDIRGGAYNLILEGNADCAVMIKADENLLHLLEVEVRGETLELIWQKRTNIRKMTKFDVYVSFEALERLEGNLVGNIKSDGAIKTRQLDVDLGGVGNLDLHIEASDADIDISRTGNSSFEGNAERAEISFHGTGNLRAEDFIVDYLDVDRRGVGNAHVYAVKELRVDTKGVGNFTYSGDPDIERINANAIGKVRKR